MNKKILPIIVVAVALLISYLIYQKSHGFKLYGIIEFQKTDIPSKLNTTVIKKLLIEGSSVSENQDLYLLSCEDVKIVYEKANKDFIRANNLHKSSAMSDELFENQKQKFDDAKLKLSWCTIKSPIKGKLLINYKEEGEYVRAGETIAQVADLNQIYVDVYVPGIDLGKYKLNQTVRVITQIGEYEGQITRINNDAEFTPKNVQTKSEKDNLVYGIRITVNNKDEKLKPGMSAEVL